jgi:hypothetical protein
MKKTAIILGILLLISNGWWLYHAIDQGVTQTYRDQESYELEKRQKQIINMMPALSENLSKEKVIEIASRYSDMQKFEKDGCIWVGWVGLKFNDKGKLESVSPTDGKDPCYPESIHRK